MIKMKGVFINLFCYFLILTLSACGGSVAETVTTPVDVIFDSQREEFLGGIRLVPPREDQWDGYGEAVDVHGDVLVVGASDWNQLGPGSVYVYRLSNEGWLEEAQLTASDRDLFTERAQLYGGQRFGTSVAVGDGIIIVGAPGSVQPVDSKYNGAVYVFEYTGDTWEETARLTPSQPGRSIEENSLEWLDFNRMKPRVFGSHVALSGDTLAVGGDADGTVYLYQRDENSWEEQTQITIPTSPERDLYVTSMSLLGETLAVSALYLPSQPNPASILTGSVAVYIFERVGTSWEESLRFLPDDGKVDYLFPGALNVGASVTLGGESGGAELLAVGLPGWPDWSGDLGENQIGLKQEYISEFADFGVSSRRSGSVYIFGRGNEGDWQQHATLKPTGWETPPGPGSFPSVPTHLEEEQENSIDPNTGLSASIDWSGFVFPGSIFSENPEVTFFGATVDLDGSRLAVTSGFANSTYLFERQGGEWIYLLRLKPKNVKVEVWEDSTQPVKISDHTLLLGTPSEFGNSAYVFDLCSSSALDCR
jgi:hypothetical protein